MSKSATMSLRRNSHAFSIMELLVVISIAMFVTGLLMPALYRAKSLASRTLCQSKLRQWGMAFAIYASDNAGNYPHADGRDRCGDEEPSTPEGIADYWFGWVDVLAVTIGEEPWRDHEKGSYPNIKSVFQCPSAKLAPESLYAYKPIRNGFFSYAMNSCLELDANCWAPYSLPGGNDMPSFLNTARIRAPDRVILLFDQSLDPAKGYGGSAIDRSAGRNCGSYPKAFSARHARPGGVLGGFVLHCDYHVAWRSTVWKTQWPVTPDFEAPPRDDPDWYPY